MKKRLSLFLAAILFVVAMTACNSGGSSSAPASNGTPSSGAPASEAPASGDKKLTFSLITMDTIDQYWLTLKSGAQKEADALGVSLRFDAPVGKTDAQAQSNMVRNAISMGVDGIMLAATDKEALAPAVEEAYKQQVPVVYVDSPSSSENYLASFTTDNYAAAAQGADQLAKLINEKGEVAVINEQQGAATTGLREKGFRDRITSQYPNIKIVGTTYANGDASKALADAKNFLAKNPNLAAFFCTAEQNTIGVAQALTQTGTAGKVKLIGFALDPNIAASIKEGSVTGVMVQDPATMGSKGVRTLYDYVANKVAPETKDTHTGITYVNKDNVDSAS